MNVHAGTDVEAKPLPRVLIVDDDEAVLGVLRRLFLEAGIRAETFTSAKALRESGNLGAPAVLLLDAELKTDDSDELLALLGTRDISAPTVFLTGHADIPVVVAATKRGDGDFLLRPFNRHEVVNYVREAFCRLVVSFPPRLPLPQPGYAERLRSLTRRERQVHDIMITGLTSKRIAREIGCSFRTIEIHRARILTKMGAANLARLIGMSFENH